MREKLAGINEVRKRFRGIFVRYGEKKNFKGLSEKTILLEKISEAGSSRILTDHIWFNYTQSFADAGFLKAGDVLEFDARVKPYSKGYINPQLKMNLKTQDYKLSHPTKVVRIVSFRSGEHPPG